MTPDKTHSDALAPCPFCGAPAHGYAIEPHSHSPVVAGEPQPSTEGPPEVWLQLHGDCAEPELSEPVDYTAGDVTWCWHSIHDSDVRYVRADLATTPQPTQAQAGAVLDLNVAAKKQVQVGWVVIVLDGSQMFFPLDELDEAATFCEDGANPVAILADAEDLKKHEEAQGETS